MITNAHPEVAQRQIIAAAGFTETSPDAVQRQVVAAHTTPVLHEDNQRDIASRALVAADSDVEQFEATQARITATKQPA